MKALAYVIGNAAYSKHPLRNPVKDAVSIADVLQRLGFIVKIVLDTTFEELDTAIDQFGNEINSYDIGLLYFAGHGIQISGENYLTAINTPFDNEIRAMYMSVKLNKVLTYMDRATNETSIIILDACRNNPFESLWTRNVASTQLAPIFAPKGTLIAFSTSPGETANDGNGSYSPYAQAILQHIETRRIPIEEFFKRVRNSLYSITDGKQTSWEHTSLAGTFVFNSGQLVQSVNTIYTETAIADSKYDYIPANEVDSIIRDLKRQNWDIQKKAVLKTEHISLSQASSDQLFVIGRSMLSAAEGNTFMAQAFIEHLEDSLGPFQQDEENHVLNGLLFEVYFGGDGHFRSGGFKTKYLDQLLKLRNTKDYADAFEFINQQLVPFQDELFYMPAPGDHSISLNIEGISGEFLPSRADVNSLKPTFEVLAIKHERKNVLHITPDRFAGFSNNGMSYGRYSQEAIKTKIAKEIAVPEDLLSLTFNIDVTNNAIIFYPDNSFLTRKKDESPNVLEIGPALPFDQL